MSELQIEQKSWMQRGRRGDTFARASPPGRPKRWAALVVLLVLLVSALQVSATEAEKPTGADIYARSNDTVFYLRTEREDGSLLTFGTGFVIRDDGTALTAAHVVKNAARMTAALGNGTQINEVQVLYQDEATDIAVVKLIGSGTFQYIPFTAVPPRAGEAVYAIGYPSKPTKLITNGIISTADGAVNNRRWMMMTAPTVSGMSGGPVLNENGIAVGIVSGSIRTMAGIHISPVTEEVIRVLGTFKTEVG